MRTVRVELPDLTKRSRRAAGVAFALIVHLAILSALAAGAGRLMRPPRTDDAVQVELFRPTAILPVRAPPPAAQARLQTAPIRPHETRSPPPATAPAPFVVPPAPPAPAQPPAPPAPQPARSPLLGLGEAMQKVLGCGDSARAGMSEAQRAACDQRAGADSRTARKLPLLIPPDKKREWDLELWKRNRPQGPPMVPCTGPGANFGFACIPDKVRPPPPSDD